VAAFGISYVATFASVVVNEMKFPDFSFRGNHFSTMSAISSNCIYFFMKCTKIYDTQRNLVTSLSSIF